MIINNKDEHIYEKDAEFYSCTRQEDATFLHRRLGKGYGKLMSTLGYPGYRSESSSSDHEEFPLPDVSYEHEWFWPHVTYQQAEKLLNDRSENMVVIRMSESKPGHFALTAGEVHKIDQLIMEVSETKTRAPKSFTAEFFWEVLK